MKKIETKCVLALCLFLAASASQAQICDPNGVALSCGQTVEGRLSLVDVDCLSANGTRLIDDYRLDAVDGTMLTLQLSAAPGDFVPVLELTSPTGDVTTASAQASGNNTAELELTLNRTGTWNLDVTSEAGNIPGIAPSGDYELVTSCVLPPVTGGCVPDAETLCIDDEPGDSRFEVKVAFETVLGGGSSGTGTPISLNSLGVNAGGLFWFFGADNPELLVKIIDGCPVNGHYWVFYAAVTEVGFDLTITDTQSGEVWQRTNPDRTTAAPQADVQALNCDS